MSCPPFPQRRSPARRDRAPARRACLTISGRTPHPADLEQRTRTARPSLDSVPCSMSLHTSYLARPIRFLLAHRTEAVEESVVVAGHAVIADTATMASNSGAGEFVDFAHGTTRQSGQNIIINGLNRAESLKAMFGSKEPGSFFTVRIDLADPSEALSAAAGWASMRHGGEICVVICRLPQSVVEGLESSRLLVHTIGPTQSVFRPGSYAIVNREARWFIANVR